MNAKQQDLHNRLNNFILKDFAKTLIKAKRTFIKNNYSSDFWEDEDRYNKNQDLNDFIHWVIYQKKKEL